MRWDPSSKWWVWLTAPLALLSVGLTLSLLSNDDRLTLLVVTSCMLGIVPVMLFHEYRKDVRKRNQMEAALRESEERYQRFVELAPIAIAIYRDGRILYFNRAWEKLLGAKSGAELAGKPLEQFLEASRRLTTEQHLAESLRLQRETAIVEQPLIRLNGDRVYVEMVAIPCRYAAEAAIQIIALDRSESKQVERALEQAAAQIAAARQAKVDFLAHISHEVRTPMNAILGMSGLMLDAGLPAEQQKNLQVIRSSADQLLAMVNDILDLAKAQAGQLELECAPFDLKTALEELVEWVRPTLAGKPVDVALIYGPKVPRHVVGDAGRIRQVVWHLLQNAAKFTERGRILLAVEEEQRSPDQTLLRLSVSDTGVGIADDKLHEIFDLFTQLDASPARKQSGLGLGLALVKRLVELMNGSLGVISKSGLGSTFHFRIPLPLASSEEEEAHTGAIAAQAPKPDSELFKGRRILLVDDNAVNLQLGLRLFERFGCRVDLAANGREAVQMADRLPYDVIFMDCQMPVMDGYEAAAEIRRREVGRRRTPIVAMTAHGLQGDREKCLRAGMDDYVCKPVNPEELRNLLAALSQAYPAPVFASSSSHSR